MTESALIESVDDYIYLLGACQVRLHDIARMQHIALSNNYLQEDEKELASIIKYNVVSAFKSISKLLELIGEHKTIDIEKTAKTLTTRKKKADSKIKTAKKALKDDT